MGSVAPYCFHRMHAALSCQPFIWKCMRQKIPVGCCASVYCSTLYNCPPRVCDLSHDDGLKQRSGNTSCVSPTSREQQTVLQWANYNNVPQSIVHSLTALIWEEKPSGPGLAEPLAPSVKNMAVTATSLTPRCCFKAVAILECQPPHFIVFMGLPLVWLSIH